VSVLGSLTIVSAGLKTTKRGLVASKAFQVVGRDPLKDLKLFVRLPLQRLFFKHLALKKEVYHD
jgi:hypothetical protein